MKTFDSKLTAGHCNPENQFDAIQAQRGSVSDYEEQERLSQPKSFKDTWKTFYNACKFTAMSYPVLSLTLAVCGYFAVSYPSFQAANFTGKIGVLAAGFLYILLLALLELGKSVLGEKAFREKRAVVVAGLVFLMLLSMVTTISGAYFTSKVVNDKTEQFAEVEASALDSINNLNSLELGAVNAQIASLQKDLSKSRNKWLKITLNEQLDKALAKQSDIKARIDRDRATTSESIQAGATDASEEDTKTAIIAGSVILIFEVVYLLAIWFKEYYRKGVVTENRYFGLIPGTVKEVEEVKEKPVSNTQKSNTESLKPLDIAPIFNNKKSNSIGFTYSNTEHSNTVLSNTEDSNTRLSNTEQPGTAKHCKHCGTVILNGTARREYCNNDDLCKHSYHAKMKGTTLELYRQGLRTKHKV